MVRRRCTLDLSVVGTIYFELGFQQSKKIDIPADKIATIFQILDYIPAVNRHIIR